MIPPLEEIEVDRINKRSSNQKKEERRTVSVDMNPMVDLAFLLLTFFMLATTFSKPFAMELVVPAKPKKNAVEKETAVKESKTLNLVLLSEELVWYNGITEPETRRIDYEEASIRALLKKQMKEIPDLVILIKPAENSNYGNLVRVIDLLNQLEAKRYALSPTSKFDKSLAHE